MPTFNRRSFLQVAAAAGLTPALPALPASAAAAPSGLSHAQMLWMNLCAKAGSAPQIADIARTMGISDHAAASVWSKVVHGHALAAHGASRLGAARPVAAKGAVGTKGAVATKGAGLGSLELDLKRIVGEEADPETAETVDLDASLDGLNIEDAQDVISHPDQG